MESLLLIFLLLFYVFLRVVFGKVQDKTADDRVKYSQGMEWIRQKQYTVGGEYFDQVLQRDSRSAFAYAMRGKCYLAQGEFIEAIVDCNRATSFDHCLADAYLDKGIALYGLKHFTEAYLEIDKAVWYAKDCAEAYRWRAIVREQLGMHEKVQQDLEKAIQLGDEHAAYYLPKVGPEPEQNFPVAWLNQMLGQLRLSSIIRGCLQRSANLAFEEHAQD